MSVEKLDYPFGISCVPVGVGHHYDGSSFPVQFRKKIYYLDTVFRVEVTRWFVSGDDRWIGGECTGYGYALLLPDGLLLRAGQRGESAAAEALPALRLPPLPSGHRYGLLLLCADSLLATWEQPLFTEVGSAGIFLRSIPDFP